MIIVLDYDGTLTVEEEQAQQLAERSLITLAKELLHVPLGELRAAYESTRQELLAHPEAYWWEVNGLIASYCDEGAFILNTTTMQVMLGRDPAYREALQGVFVTAEYDPIVDCTNYLFHRHTAELPVRFRPFAVQLLNYLLSDAHYMPLVLTNSLGDKVARRLGELPLESVPEILGDTRQYEMDPTWTHRFPHPTLGAIQIWPLACGRQIDLRRPAYYRALKRTLQRDRVIVVADTLSLPGALPLMMGIPFVLVRTSYTPAWCIETVREHSLGTVVEDLADLPRLFAQLGK